MTLRIVVIGLGKQSRDDHLPAIEQSQNFELVGICDTDQKKTMEISTHYNVPCYVDLGELINAQDFQVALVSIPHHAYLNVISTLVMAGKHIIKEKPLATNIVEARQLLQILRSGSVYLGITVQRRFNPIYRTFHQLKRYIGKIYSIEGAYTMNVVALDTGWRASKDLSGGGALVDIMLTDNEEMYYRALLQGHYNKRCKQEIPAIHPLSTFNTTGFGLKFRAHPLAVAMAQEQFVHLDKWLAQRQRFVEKMTTAFNRFPFLQTPPISSKRHGWYAYVIQFDAARANGVDINLFTKAILAEGLVEFDRPRSTGTLHRLPLFTNPDKALPRLYPHPAEQKRQSFPMAEQFYENALKLPVWSFPDEEQMVDLYIDGIVKVSSVVRDNPTLLIAAEVGK